MNFDYSEAPYRIRDDIPEAHRRNTPALSPLQRLLGKLLQPALTLVVKLMTRNMSKPD